MKGLFDRIVFSADEGSGGTVDTEVTTETTGADQPAGETSSQEQATANWRDTISDESLRSVAERFNSPADAIKAVADLRKQVSVSIQKPGKDASPEDVQKFYKALGVPDSPEGYKFQMPEGKEATEADKAFQSTMAQAFHAAGVTAPGAEVLNKVWNDMQVKAEQAMVEADKEFAAQADAALKKEWGTDYERNKTFANRAAVDLFDDFESAKKIEMKDGRFLLDHPAIVKMLAKVGGEMAEDGFRRMDSAEAATLQEQADDLGQQVHDALARGEQSKARELDAKRMAIYARLK